jgi:hypothetical protein
LRAPTKVQDNGASLTPTVSQGWAHSRTPNSASGPYPSYRRRSGDAEVSGAANDFGVSLRSDGRITAGTGTPDVSIVSSSAGYNDGTWHHVVFTRTRSSGALNLYVDGVSAGSATGATASLTSPASINFGRIHTGTNYFAGSLDEVATYNVALSQATVTAHYQAR